MDPLPSNEEVAEVVHALTDQEKRILLEYIIRLREEGRQ